MVNYSKIIWYVAVYYGIVWYVISGSGFTGMLPGTNGMTWYDPGQGGCENSKTLLGFSEAWVVVGWGE